MPGQVPLTALEFTDDAALEGATLDGATLDKETLDSETLDRETLDGAALEGALLDGTELAITTLLAVELDVLVASQAPKSVQALAAAQPTPGS